jgi:DHA1 family tetracycline resistance protein-like MFS transporter
MRLRVEGGPRTKLRRLIPLYLVVFVGFLGYSLMITVFTPMILDGGWGPFSAASSTAKRTLVLGVLLALYPLGQFVGAPIVGALSDRFGRRPVLLVSLAATTAWYAVIAVALVTQSLALLFVASLCAGLSEGNIVIAQSAIADAAAPADRERLFGYVYLAASMGYVVGPLAGGKLADAALGTWFGYSAPYWVVAVLLSLMLAWMVFGFAETRGGGRERGQISYLEAVTNLKNIVSGVELRRLYLINFLMYLAIFGFFRVYPMYLVDEFDLGVSRVSEFVAWVGVPIVIVNLGLVAALARRLSARATVVVFGLATGVLMSLIVVPRVVAALWITLGSTALGVAICLPACAAMLSLAVRGNDQGSVLGNNQSLQVGAEALSGFAGGALAALVVKLPLLVFAGFAVVAALLATRPRVRRADAAPSSPAQRRSR